VKRFDGKKADTALPVKLREELPGVLAWAVRGCVVWVEKGLGSAKAVESATAAYRAETDLLEQFFQDRCYFYPKGRVSRKELFKAWATGATRWAKCRERKPASLVGSMRRGA
jgi:putative DNA primase/helicase